jgi:hypothetical protein
MEMLERTIHVGIDPDVNKSGVAMWCEVAGDYTHLEEMTFFKLFELLCFHCNKIQQVVIEAGWLNKKHNWHGRKGAAAERISNNVGRNHETGRKLVEMCDYLGLEYVLVRPKRSKFKAETFRNITGYDIKNQDIIDAAMLVYQINT